MAKKSGPSKRITSISNFIENGSNLIANSAILFCGESSSVSVNDVFEVRKLRGIPCEVVMGIGISRVRKTRGQYGS